MAAQDFSLLLNIAPDAPAAAGSTSSADAFVDTFGSALAKQESGGKQLRPDGTPVTSSKGAIGKWQVMPDTAPEAARLAGVEFDDVKYRNDASYNETLGKAYLKKQFETYQDPAKALAAYNAGPGALDRALATAEKAGTPGAWLRYLPRETQAYVPAIMNRAGKAAAVTQGSYSDVKPAGPGATAGDYAKELTASAVEGVGSIGQMFGEGMAAIANAATGTENYEGSNPLKPAAEAIRGSMTAGGQAARQEANVEGSVLDLLSGDAQLPSSPQAWGMMAANGFGSLASFLIPALGPAGRVASLTKAAQAAEAAGDVAKAAELIKAAQSAATVGRVTGAGVGGAMTGGAAADDVRQSSAQAISQMTHQQLLANVPVYAEAFKASGDEQQARNAVINSAARWAAGLSAIAGAAGGAFNSKVIEDMLTHKGISSVLGNSAGSKLGRAAIGAAGGGFAEGGQETSEKVGQNIGENIALGRAPGQDAFRNTAGDFLGGAVVGGPIGAGGGFVAKPGNRQPAPNPLQSVVDQAQKPGSVLSRAVVATGVTEQTVAPSATPTDAQNAAPQAANTTATDPLSQRVQGIEAGMRSDGWLDNLRDDGVNTNELLGDLAVARNPNNPEGARAAALERVETAIHFANQVAQPRGAMDSIQNNPAFDQTEAEPRAAAAVPDLGAVATALRDPNLRNKISDEDRNQLLYLYNIAGNSQGENNVRVNAARQALEIVGRYQAPAGTPGSTTPALEQAAPATAPIASPAEQQNVATPTELDFLQAVQEPKVSIPAGEGSALMRKRGAVVKQLADNGFETVQRDGKDFYMVNSKTGQKFKLDGPADAQLARKAIKDRLDAIAHTAAASPKNDLLEPTQAQIEAGNYKKSDVIELNGMRIKIENPKDSIRRGVAADGKAWETKMAHHYGEFQGTVGADGDKLDVFVGPRPDSQKVYVIDQVNKDGSFDEHKVMMGFTSEEAAREGYLANYDKGWTGLGAITEMGIDEFKTWAKSRAAKKPLSSAIGNPKVAEKAAESNPEVAANENFTEAEKAEERAFFYVNDGSKQHKLKLIKSGELPKKPSAQRDGKHHALTQGEAALIEKVASTLNKKVVFFEAQEGRLADGFVRQGQPDTIYVATETTVNPLAVFGHEFFHTLRETNPAAWDAIAAVTGTKITGQQRFRKDRYGKDVAEAKGDAALSTEQGGELEELVSDLGGNLLKDSKFWKEVFAKIEEANGDKAKGIIAKLSAAIQRAISKMVKAINQPGYRADSFVKDLDEVRAAFADAMAQHLNDTGIAERATEIKKSEDRPDGLTVEGYHFSKAPRQVLNSAMFGTGLKGSARDEIKQNSDERLKQRISFYVDKGTGINPEAGVGGYAHKATLSNVYDADADPLRLRTGDARAFESKVLDNGYSGYLTRLEGTQSGQVIMLGKQTIKPESVTTGKITDAQVVPAPQERKQDAGDKIIANKALPSGALTPQRWAEVLMSQMPEVAAELMDVGAFTGDTAIYKDELAAKVRALSGQIKKSADRARDEYAAVEAEYKGTDEWLKAPNGKDTNLSERQWVQVRTPAFKKWFGDWEAAIAKGGVWAVDDVSKAVDDNGEPMVVYHGTNKGGFSEFNEPGGEKRGDLGIFTTPNLAMAQTYYSRRGGEIELPGNRDVQDLLDEGYQIYETDDGKFEVYSIDGYLDNTYDTRQEAEEHLLNHYNTGKLDAADESGYYAMFVNIRNPIESDFEGAHWNGERPGKYQVMNQDGELQYDSEGKAYFDMFDDANEFAKTVDGGEVQPADDHYETTDSVVREARRYDNDGAVIRSVVDSGPGYSAYIDEPSDVFVALSPEQLKSANYNDGSFSADSQDLRFSKDRKQIPETVDAVTAVEPSFEFAASQVFPTNRDFKLELQNRARAAAKAAKVSLDQRDERTENYLVRVGEKDARAGLKLNGNAVGWYNEKVSKALAVVALIHPELKTNPEARFAFTWALAVTSNGMKVNKNFELAEMVYEQYKRTGRMPTDIKAGTTQGAINDSLSLFNELRKAWGIEQLMDFMTTKDTVKSIEKSSGVSISGEGQNTQVYGAAILGPKIGNGFFMNLYGQFDQLTMDRWLMRTWGRWTGTLVENDKANIKKKREQLDGLIRLMPAADRKEFERIIGSRLTLGNINKAAELIKKASAKPALRERMNALAPLNDDLRSSLDELLGAAKKNAKRESIGSEMRKVGNSLFGYLDGQKEAPAGSVERDFIRKVFSRILDSLKADMPDLTMADLQAVVWYPEKRLYDAAKAEEESESGYSDDEAPDYANAAADLASQKGVPADKIAQVTKEIDDEISTAKRARNAGRGDSEPGQAGTSAAAQAAESAQEGGLSQSDGVRRSAERVAVAGGQDQGLGGREEDGSLSGLPRDFTVDGKEITASHWAPAETVARLYMAEAGLPYNPPAKFVKVDPQRATRIAAEYDKLKHDPQNPEVKAAYAALARETIAQYRAIVDSGLEVEFINFAEQGDPYAASPRLMTEDVRNNNHMYVFSTRDGFGSDAEFDPVDNPLLAETEFEISAQKALVNDLFRVVHDYFGHVKEGVGFRADGEENTWRAHSAMFSPLAQRALTTETRGQNNWVNYGPEGESNRKASAGDTHYADQKVGLLPMWVSEDGRGDGPGPDGGIKMSVDRPQFYSQLQRSIEQVPARLDNMSAVAWKQWLTGNASKLGVKADEIEWSGIKDYLDLQGKKKLSKADLVAYLDDSGVKVGEKMLGDIKDFSALSDDQLRAEYERIRGYKAESYGEPMSRDEMLDELEGALDEDLNDTKYGRYVLPGASNYRELLITLPFREPAMPAGYEVTEMDYGKGDMRYFANTPTTRSSAYKTRAEAEAELKRMADGLKDWRAEQAAYQSPHWDEANVLAHIRINDRTDANGKRVLFVEELQSDWGQQGKKRGFDGELGGLPEGFTVKEETGRSGRVSWVVRNEDGVAVGFGDTREEAVGDIPRKGIPLAPFVTKTEGWLNLALKRIAMMAVEGGYDKVAFVNGDQSADRYDLSKQVDEISYEPTAKGYYINVMADGRNIKNGDFTAAELEDIVGKEIVQKMEAREGKVEGTPGAPDYEDLKDIRNLTGEGLKVGGEGMKAFYDKLVPQALNKLLPKLGGEKLGDVSFGKLEGRFTIIDVKSGKQVGRYSTLDEASSFMRQAKSAQARGVDMWFDANDLQHKLDHTKVTQPGFDVTDKMRETVGQGVALFSPDRPYFDDLSQLKITTNYQLGDLLKTSKKLSWWDRTIGTQYNLAQKRPQFKRVFDAVQRFIGDVSAYATRAADLAPTILPKLETWKDIGKTPLSAADVKALRDPIFGGTLNYTRDAEGNLVEATDVSTAGVVFTNEELREKFGLDDRQIGLYREFRRATNKSLSDLATSDMLRYLGTDGEGVRQRALEAKNLDGALDAMVAHLDQLIEQQPQRAKVLEDSKRAIKEKAGQAIGLMSRGYAPLSRFGQYTVYAVGKDGEQLYFSMFENDRDAQKMAREMRDQYPDATVTTGTMSQESYKLFSGVTPETLALFGESLGMEESGIDAKSEVFQQYLKMAKTNRSAMKRLIQRKGIDGFSEDAGRVLAGFVYSNARQISTNLHAGEIGRSASAVTDGDVKDAAIRLMEYVQNPREEAQALRGLMFTNFIGGSIASAAVNLTQPFTMTMPYLSQFAGATGAATRMADAVKLASRGIRNDDELKAALKKAEDEGVVSPQEVHQLMAQAQGKGALQSGDGTKLGDAAAKVNNSLAKLGLGWGKVFSAAEQFNRRVTFIAAYKLAREQGMADPMAFAAQAIAETQGIFNKGNKPAWARGAVGATLFTFKQYSIGYVEFLRRMWGNGPEGKKAVGLALGVLFLMSGLGGMPGADDLDDVIDGFAQRVLGRSFDTKQAKKEFFASILGQSGAEFVMSGVSGLPGMPIDVAGRMGLGNLVPGTGLFTKKRDYGRDYLEIAGPAGTLFTNAGTAIGAVASGEFQKAAEAVSPVAAQNWVKAVDMATMGFYRDQKGRKVIDTDAWDVAAKAAGFQPRAVAQVQEATGVQQNLITQNKLRETEIADKWAAGRIENNPSKIAEAKEMLADWNRKNPDSKISIDASQVSKRVQEANKTKAQRIAATAPKELRTSVKRELERETQ